MVAAGRAVKRLRFPLPPAALAAAIDQFNQALALAPRDDVKNAETRPGRSIGEPWDVLTPPGPLNRIGATCRAGTCRRLILSSAVRRRVG
jgi:hypothetical protein